MTAGCSAHGWVLSRGAVPWKKFFLGAQLTAAIFVGRNEASLMLVEVSSKTIIQFLEMFMDLGGQREAVLKYICGFVKRRCKDRDGV